MSDRRSSNGKSDAFAEAILGCAKEELTGRCQACGQLIDQYEVTPEGAWLKCGCTYWTAPYNHVGSANMSKLRVVREIDSRRKKA
jgi:hypothetical protein